MLRKEKVVIACMVAFGAMALSVSAVARRANENERPRSEADQYRMRAEQTLKWQLEDLRAREIAWQSLSETERQEMRQSASEKAAREAAEMFRAEAAAEATSSPVQGCSFVGLRYPDREPAVPGPTAGRDFSVVNYWGGTLDGECQGVWAGSLPRNPLQGELLIFNKPDSPHSYNLYPTPTATGPLRIVGEKNGLLTAVSVAGIYNKNTEYDSATISGGTTFEAVKAPGGATYIFDLRTLRYR